METTFVKHDQITPDITLEELEKIRAEWIEFARDPQTRYAETVWTIVRWLGEIVPTNSSITSRKFVDTASGIEVTGNEKIDRFGVREQAFITTRTIHVWVGKSYVMRWGWEVNGTEIKELEFVDKKPILFVPGKWVEQLLLHANRAWMKEAEFSAATIEEKRDKLMKEMLIGVDL